MIARDCVKVEIPDLARLDAEIEALEDRVVWVNYYGVVVQKNGKVKPERKLYFYSD